MAEAKLGKGKKAESSNQEKIVATFQQLRAEQRAIANKISELEGEKREHQYVDLIGATYVYCTKCFILVDRIVLEALKDVPADRCCFRMVGGVLVERTVKDVTPALQHNTEQVLCKSLVPRLTLNSSSIPVHSPDGEADGPT